MMINLHKIFTRCRRRNTNSKYRLVALESRLKSVFAGLGVGLGVGLRL